MSRFRLDPAEVTSGIEAAEPASSSGRAPARTVWLQHQPTGLKVSAEVVTDPGVADEPPVREAELRKSLFAELELKVARHLGIAIQPE